MSMDNHKQRGAVSIFIVVFSALLITTITIVFIRIMIQNQMQATANDLSKSALDSANAGVEDAKRLVVMYNQQCSSHSIANRTTCDSLLNLMGGNDGKSTQCTTLQQAGVVGSPSDKEVLIKQSEGDKELNQAYTCVKVQLNTFDYVGSLVQNTSRLIPLKAEDGQKFTHIEIQWYSQKDFQADSLGSAHRNTVDLRRDLKLPTDSGTSVYPWTPHTPALMRLQLFQYGKTFSLDDFNFKSNNATLFLVPSEVGLKKANFADDERLSSIRSGVLSPIRCENTDFSAGEYACSATITLTTPKDASSDGTDRHAYLNVSEFYNTNTTFRVCLESCGNPTDPSHPRFSGVQPIVDSTGRANTYFRRVQSRVEFTKSSIPNVEATVDITGSLCKAFQITDSTGDYKSNSHLCKPSS